VKHCAKQERNSNEVRLGVKPNHAHRLNYLRYRLKNLTNQSKNRKYRLAICSPWDIIKAQLTTTKGGDQWYLLQVSRDNLLSCSSHTSNEGRFLTGPFFWGDTLGVLEIRGLESFARNSLWAAI
jgi:hypothetical protein